VFISVGVPTCNRPDHLERCLASLASVVYPDWKVIVIDQSDGEQTRQIVDGWKARIPQLAYVRLKQKNASGARNVAIAKADGDILAFLDDDCTVSSDWLDRVCEAFANQPKASLIFGSVTAADHDPSATFIPIYQIEHEMSIRGSIGTLRVHAMGAAMYVRLAWARQSFFDVLLGPGTRFRSSEDWDYAYRLLAAGGVIVATPRIVVTHHGARSYGAGAVAIILREYFYGIGAAHAKLLRCGQWIMVAVIIDKLTRSIALIRPHKALVHQPTQLGRVLMYVRGLRDGLRAPIDRQKGVFQTSPNSIGTGAHP
jgi:glycosyltransferase involved in cell wall biosynthesis